MHEEWLLPYMEAKREGEVALDIGANIGQFVEFLSTQYGKVIAFEPHPEAFSKLKEIDKSNIELHNVAVMNFDGKVELNLYEDSLYTSVRKRKEEEHTEEGVFKTECIRLDSLKLERVDFVLIDVEGAEVEVIEGALETLKVQKPRLLIEMYLFLREDAKQKIEGALPYYKWGVIRHPAYPEGSFNWHHHYWLYSI